MNHGLPPRLLAYMASLVLAFLGIFAAGAMAQEQPNGANGDKGTHYSYTLDLSSPEVRGQLKSGGVEVVNEGPNGEPCLKISLPANPQAAPASLMRKISIPIDPTPLRGAKISISGLARGEGISAPVQKHAGLKCQLYLSSPSVGQAWINEGNVHGTFPWRTVCAMASVQPDVDKGAINLGLEESSGTMWITNVRVQVVMPPVVRPAPKAALAQTSTTLRGVMSPIRPKEEDFRELSRWNVNFIRWQMVGKKEDLDHYDQWLAGKLDDLAVALDAAQANGIKLVADLHFSPGGRSPEGTSRLFLEEKYQTQFVANWEKIARRFKDHPALWAYDLINEPLQNQPSPAGVKNWLEIQVAAAKAVRAIDPKTPIIIETDEWDGPTPYLEMKPVDVPNVIYQVHMYFPGDFTHQGVFTDQGIAKDNNQNVATVTYPGMIARHWTDKETLRRWLEPVREFQRAYDARIYVGEFSAIRWAPGAAQYLDDCISIFEEYGWDWTYHAFREWPGWSVEAANLPFDRNHHPAATEPTDRFLVLQKWFRKNKPQAP